MTKLRTGQLVWCKLKGFSQRWPGLITAPDQACDKARAMQPAKSSEPMYLVSFFPDSKWQWVTSAQLVEFDDATYKEFCGGSASKASGGSGGRGLLSRPIWQVPGREAMLPGATPDPPLHPTAAPACCAVRGACSQPTRALPRPTPYPPAPLRSCGSAA
jgi:hypothetical protein